MTFGAFISAKRKELRLVSNTSASERQHKCKVLISEAMGIASVQNPLLTGICRVCSRSDQIREM